MIPSVITLRWHSDIERCLIVPNRHATYLWNPIYTCRTSTSFPRRCPMFPGIWVDVGWLSLGWCSITYNIHKSQSEPLQIFWKLIANRLGGMYRRMKNSSTILLGLATVTLSRQTFAWWCQPAADLTPWTRSLITSAKCNYVTGSLWECLGVVGPASQGGQIPEITGPTQWPSGAPRSTGECRRHDWEHQQQAW